MPTRQAFAVEMVGREDVANAVALNSAMFNGARVIGPAVAGLTIGAFGVADRLPHRRAELPRGHRRPVADARGGAAARRRSCPADIVREVFANLGEGLRYVRRDAGRALAVAVVGLVATFGMNFTILIPPLAQDVLHSDASGYGFLMAASGLGSLVAALAIAFTGGARRRRIALGAMVLGVAEVAHRA